jgi:DNA-binding CsgD family transcriptional regulator
MRRGRVWLLAAVAAGLSVGLAFIDTWLEGEGFDPADFAVDVVEQALLFGAVTVIAWLAVEMREVRGEQAALREDLVRAAALGAAWRTGNAAAIDDLAAAIRDQFAAWALTPAEADIAGLLLKGVSLRDIAALRRTSEATIRQQAQSVYRKSGLAGRRELAAYFLESLFESRASEAAQ